MKVCLIVEGAYPYITGGVSSWIQQMLTRFSDIEFVIQTLVVDRNEKREFKYKIPDNVSEIHELYLLDDDYIDNKKKKFKLKKKEYEALESLFFGTEVDWDGVFKFFQNTTVSLDKLLTSKEFFQMTKNYYNKNYENAVFTDFLWTMRSMYLPLFLLLKNKPVKADLYHSMSTGYSGVFGSMCKYLYNKPLLISEHGIYTREREEEIIKAKWVRGLYKDLWIQQFHKFSSCCYDFGDEVTALFEGAREFQIDLGCLREKTNVIHNGVNVSDFEVLPQKDVNDKYINCGAVLRVTPIKDVKTMINAFYLAKKQVPNLKLWIMGPLDEKPKYVEECRQLIKDLGAEDVIFTGRVNVKEYLGKMDFTVLSSLSEGQPLVILEGFAAKKPCISTNVGDCFSLIYGENDQFGDAGIVVPVMNVEKMAKGMVYLAKEEKIRVQMGLNGYNRANNFYQNDDVFHKYYDLYNKLTDKRRQAVKGKVR
ncbi:GT4 family glycosyltransferase PelF [Oceanirhabdus sp. W0125-5]|nr:GT4 family glycosyltransferase PelF [Oceanirhabdus sp. W0125-5]WBW99717.1 GT4 family glycosyltransferase PelF [Oceanirhabdus sp. W0125-5]